jgi:L-rhamnose isomerase
MSQILESAAACYAKYGIDASEAMSRLKEVPVSIHCWQGDDVQGFEPFSAALSGGIQTTGNYPYRARNFTELTQDFDIALSLIPGKKRLNLHASYAVFSDDAYADRDSLEPNHFKAWIAYARERNIGIDFNPTFFSHPLANSFTLSHPDDSIRHFWIRHAIACRRIAAFFASELHSHCLCNIWIPDGYKDVPADRLGPRMRLRDSLDQIFSEKLPGVIDSVESKVFGIGLEAYTVGSSEFYTGYASTRPGVYPLLDSGHYHPTEFISDKISSYLCFFNKVPLHVTRAMRWDSDHVVLFDDELREIATEIVRNDAVDRVLIGLDFFDASINRIAAWAIGARSMQKALLYAFLMPHKELQILQASDHRTKLLILQEEVKTLPFYAIWEAYCVSCGVPADDRWYDTVKAYEDSILVSGRV